MASDLTGRQRAYLRGLANGLDPVVRIGKDGIGEAAVRQADEALEARELIKCRVLANCVQYDARSAAEGLARATRSEPVQAIGSVFVLYRPSHTVPAERRIVLPAGKRPR